MRLPTDRNFGKLFDQLSDLADAFLQIGYCRFANRRPKERRDARSPQIPNLRGHHRSAYQPHLRRGPRRRRARPRIELLHNRFIELELRSAIQAGKRLTHQSELDHQHTACLA
jgi:hypothetical protein